MLAREPVALLLTDWYLPEAEGDALIREVHQRNPAMPAILMSNAWQVTPAADAAGADGCYRKGEPLDTLRALIRRLLAAADTCEAVAVAT